MSAPGRKVQPGFAADGFRARLFLELYWQVHAEWEWKLVAGGSTGFEDMLVRAAGHLEAGDVVGTPTTW
jgi:DNA helicase-4